MNLIFTLYITWPAGRRDNCEVQIMKISCSVAVAGYDGGCKVTGTVVRRSVVRPSVAGQRRGQTGRTLQCELCPNRAGAPALTPPGDPTARREVKPSPPWWSEATPSLATPLATLHFR